MNLIILTRVLVLVLAAFGVQTTSVQAIEITCLGKLPVTYDFGPWGSREMSHIGISGEFESGDHEKFKSAFKTLSATPGGCYSDGHKSQTGASGDGYVLVLNSQGGNFVEAIRLASHVSENFIGTYVGPNEQCLSACALVFMSGKQHLGDGDKADGKRMHYTAQIGLHSPFLPQADLSRLPPEVLRDVLQSTYGEAIQAASELTVLAIRAGWEPGFVNLVLRTPADKFMYIDTFGKAGDWNIQLEGLQVPDATSVEQLKVACINYVHWRNVDAGLALDNSDTFDPGQLLSPLPADFLDDGDASEFDPRKEARKDGRPGESLVFSSEWLGERCRFDIDPAGKVSGNVAWNQPYQSTHLIHSYVRLDSVTASYVAPAPPPSTTPPGQIILAQAVDNRLWDHNGSIMRSFMRPDGGFEIVYHQPRAGLSSIGVVAGSPLITATVSGQSLKAVALLFSSKGCPALQYWVTGQLAELFGTQLVLRGPAPRRDNACNVIGSDDTGPNASLSFRRLN